jgi:predicted kinase
VTKWLLITCGYPFSGKTTLARAVAEELGFTLVSVDDQHELRGVSADARVISERDWLHGYRSAYEQARAAFGRGESVIFDSVGHLRRNRDRLRRIAHRSGAKSLVVVLAVTESEAMARLERNRANPIRPQVPSEGFAQIVLTFEPPNGDELQITFDPREDLRLWMSKRLRPMLGRREISA